MLCDHAGFYQFVIDEEDEENIYLLTQFMLNGSLAKKLEGVNEKYEFYNEICEQNGNLEDC